MVGLGNPGPTYAQTRHNVGQLIVAALADELGVKLSRHRTQSLVGQNPGLVLAAPTSYMNESGGQVAGLVKYFHVEPERIVVVHDELDLPFGTVRLKRGGGEGGHNGLRSISTSLRTSDYGRLRVGIGRPPGSMNPADFVLRPFSSSERPNISVTIATAAEVLRDVMTQGWVPTQNRVNTG